MSVCTSDRLFMYAVGKKRKAKKKKVSGVSRKKETRKVELKKRRVGIGELGESVEGVIYDG